MAPQQMSFELPGRTALGREDFFVSPANAPALARIDDWQDWPTGRLILSGPSGAGKTHLTQVWAAQSGARILAAGQLKTLDLSVLAPGPLAVEDVPEIAGDTTGETALFHLHNLVQSRGDPLLLNGQGQPARWPLILPDLHSRLVQCLTAELLAPDDALLQAVITKLFLDRQLNPPPDLVPYLIKRMDRSFGAAYNWVNRLDQAALSQKRNISVSLARKLFDAEAATERF